MKRITLLLCLTFLFYYSKGQSKVFKTVSKEMETKIKSIMQDNNLVGYLIFTKLERSSTDSFRYKLAFLDENLNDIGSYSFSNQNLQIQDVAFDNNVLCIGYLCNNAPETMKMNEFSKKVKNIKSSVYLQFMNLNGELINDHSEAVNATYNEIEFSKPNLLFAAIASPTMFKGALANPIRIKNIPENGFCVTFAESKFISGSKINNKNSSFNAGSRQKMQTFDYTGKNLWSKILPDSKVMYSITLASSASIYVLRNNRDEKESSNSEGCYDLLNIRTADGHLAKQQKLLDNKRNPLKVLNFSNEINSNSPVVSGLIVKKNSSATSEREIAKGKNLGIFTVNAEDSVFNTQLSYWSTGACKPEISKKSYLHQSHSYPGINYSFSDAENNTYFVGTGIVKKTRWGSIAASVITIPLIVPPIWILGFGGSVKYKYKDAVVLKQDTNGKVSFYANLASNSSNRNRLNLIKGNFNEKSYFTVNQGKNLVLNDEKSIFIYDISNKSLVKKIPHKENGIKTEIFKAKEGHIMIAEYNTSEKSTKLSIESL